ncbi:MAG: hypothetical protein V4764_26835 [Burkholderia sp.]
MNNTIGETEGAARRAAWRRLEAAFGVSLLLAWPAWSDAHASAPPREAPGLAEIVAPHAYLSSRSALAGSGALRFAPGGPALPRGADVVIGAGRDGDVRSEGRLHATYVDARGVATSGWVDRHALHALPVRHAGHAWDGHWRSSAGGRDLTISQGSVSYSYRSARAPGGRAGLLLRLKEVEPDRARLSHADPLGGPCELDARQLGHYLVIAARGGCQVADADPDAVLRRVR